MSKIDCRLVALVFLLWLCHGPSQAVGEDVSSPSSYRSYDEDVLDRVANRMESVLAIPLQAVDMLTTFHRNDGFRPYGLHAQERDRVLTYLYSLIVSFNGLKLYLGTEKGEFFTYFETEGVYREPGNSGYNPMSSTTLNKYWPICVNGDNGASEKCQMAEGSSYVQCEEAGCETLFPCSTLFRTNSANTWCSNYTIKQVLPGEIRGFIPVGYYCIEENGAFSQEQGKVLVKIDGEILSDGVCTYGDGTPVTRSVTGSFAYCNDIECDGTYNGLIRTVDYDARVRPWYIRTKSSQQPNWSPPYPFHTHSNIITRVGITYSHPFYTIRRDGNHGDMAIFEGVIAVDFTLHDISLYLSEAYGGTREDVVVTVFEAAEPYYLVGISTGTSPYREVSAADKTQPCEEGQECRTIRVEATKIGTTIALNDIASYGVQAQAAANFPANEPVVFKLSKGKLSGETSYICHSKPFSQSGAGLEWIIVVTSPLTRSSSDTIQSGDVLFVSLIFVASVGLLCCGLFLALWYSFRNHRIVLYGDYRFTMAFIVGCVFLNLSSFTSLGDSTDLTCMLRFWAFNLSFSLALAPLLVKVYRVYLIIGAGSTMSRRKLNNKQAALRVLPIIAVELVILTIFTLVDPPTPVEEIAFDSLVPILHISCQHQSKAFFYTESSYKLSLVMAGCALSFLSRDLDVRFGEAKQLLFGMYNIAFTGLCFFSLTLLVDLSPSAFHMFRAIGVFWGTVLTCAVFVLPRVIAVKRFNGGRSDSSVHVSGFMTNPSERQLRRSVSLPSSPITSSSPMKSRRRPVVVNNIEGIQINHLPITNEEDHLEDPHSWDGRTPENTPQTSGQYGESGDEGLPRADVVG